jgi:predicted phosphoribosyltransferase
MLMIIPLAGVVRQGCQAAAPVASLEAINKVRAYTDEVVCLQTLEFFYAVGQFYLSFPQVDDDEVIALLRSDENTRPQSIDDAAEPSG